MVFKQDERKKYLLLCWSISFIWTTLGTRIRH